MKLWKELTKILFNYGPDNLIFAIKTSCALWKILADYPTERIRRSSRQSFKHLSLLSLDEP